MANRNGRDLALGGLAAVVAILVACARGPVESLPPTVQPMAAMDLGGNTREPHAPFTDASGVVVREETGKPMAGIRVALEPWRGGATPLPKPQATTNAEGRFTLAHARNGHYLLVIGDDSATSKWATVHDNVTLKGGAQTLVAPTMPPVPTVKVPAWRSNGSYRIAKLNAKNETPCNVAANQLRVKYNLPPFVVDEWMLENNRNNESYFKKPGAKSPPWPNNPTGSLSGKTINVSGGSSCGEFMNVYFAKASYWERSRIAVWFVMDFYPYQAGSGRSAFGNGEVHKDPRIFTDPSRPVWL